MKTAFELYHPLFSVAYFIGVILLMMCAFQPIYIVLFTIGAIVYECLLEGARTTMRSLAWKLPLVAIIAFLNPLFSSSGSTEIARIAGHGVYAESLFYGACMGMLLIGVITWFSVAAHVLSIEKVASLLADRLPNTSLIIRMTMRLIPRLIRQGKMIGSNIRACTSARGPVKREKRGRERRFAPHDKLRMITTLMSLALEDSLISADAMRARGWDCGAHRTRYRSRKFRLRDGIAIGMLAVLFAICGCFAWVDTTAYSFYPTLSPISQAAHALCVVALLLVPAALFWKERCAWKK